ncbi:hypothetical protein CR513_55404, partial [Mucuna pruriens]
MTNYEVKKFDQREDSLTNLVLFSDCDPLTFDKVVQHPKMEKTMDEEISSIERNNTWELTKLPKGHKTIDNGEMDKLKACLVEKGFKQEFGVDYKEVFAPIAQLDTIKLTNALAA